MINNEKIIKIFGVLLFSISLALGKSWQQHFYVTAGPNSLLASGGPTYFYFSKTGLIQDSTNEYYGQQLIFEKHGDDYYNSLLKRVATVCDGTGGGGGDYSLSVTEPFGIHNAKRQDSLWIISQMDSIFKWNSTQSKWFGNTTDTSFLREYGEKTYSEQSLSNDLDSWNQYNLVQDSIIFSNLGTVDFIYKKDSTYYALCRVWGHNNFYAYYVSCQFQDDGSLSFEELPKCTEADTIIIDCEYHDFEGNIPEKQPQKGIKKTETAFYSITGRKKTSECRSSGVYVGKEKTRLKLRGQTQ
ncbi:MAG: hypothetical protein M0P13_12335 [Fibrobacteraceae bacterium]|nr:hypothetical protein [Fibrobacteraceae bacterium]